MAESRFDNWVRRQGWLEGVSDVIQKIVGGFYGVLGRPGRSLKSLMHGTWPVGHPLHPALTDIPIGALTFVLVADIVAHFSSSIHHAAATWGLLVAFIAALASVATGYTDFHETFGHERRVAVLHGLCMSLVLVLMAVSLFLRHSDISGAHAPAVVISTVAWVLIIAGGYLGGHLVFGLGTQVNRNAFAEGPEDYIAVGKATEFPEGELKLVQAGPMPVLVVRQNGVLHAIANTCAHAGGPLNEGELVGTRVRCPWHQSEFELATGRVKCGPATFSQPALQIRETDAGVELKLPHPLH